MKFVRHVLIQLHYGSLIAASVAIVRRAEDGYDILLVAPIVALHDQLMCSGNQGKPIGLVELFGNVVTKRIASSSGGYSPTVSVIRIGPKQVAHRAFVGNLLNSIQRSNMIERVDGGRESAMEAEDLIRNQSSERQIVKEVGEELPHVGIAVFLAALVVKSVHLSDLPTLVVATQNGDSVLESNFQRNQKRNRLNRVVPSIDVVTHE